MCPTEYAQAAVMRLLVWKATNDSGLLATFEYQAGIRLGSEGAALSEGVDLYQYVKRNQ